MCVTFQTLLATRRYTNQGDTVLSVGAECNKGVEVALGRGRRVEAFVGQESKKEEVQKRLDESFADAYNEGFFKVTAGRSTCWDVVWMCVVCPTCMYCISSEKGKPCMCNSVSEAKRKMPALLSQARLLRLVAENRNKYYVFSPPRKQRGVHFYRRCPSARAIMLYSQKKNVSLTSPPRLGVY